MHIAGMVNDGKFSSSTINDQTQYVCWWRNGLLTASHMKMQKELFKVRYVV